MEIRELKYFLAIAREQSISKAAEFLYMTQPSLSRQMQNLEKEIGKPLFIRGNKRITLTEAGVLLRKRAEEMLSLYEKTQAELSAPSENISGEVFIGGGESYSVHTVAQAAYEVQKSYPAICFNFFSGDACDVTEKLDKGLIDFGILVDLPDISKYNSLRLPYADEWGVLTRKDSPLAEKEFITAGDLRDKPVITSQQSLKKGAQIYEWFGGDVEGLHVAGKYNLLYNASLLVKSGMGYALGLNNIINTTGESMLCFKPLFPAVHTNLDIVWKKYAVFSKPAQIFLDKLNEIIAGATKKP